MLFSNHKQNATIIFALVIFSATLKRGVGMETITGSPHALEIKNQHSIRSSSESISTKLLHLRHLVMSLFSDWNFGESRVEGTFNFIFFPIDALIELINW